MNMMLVQDAADFERMIADRKRMGLDVYDEVWNGVYVMPSAPTVAHQRLVHSLQVIFDAVVIVPGRGDILPGANVTDRHDWKQNYRIPDVIVMLHGGRAVNHDSYILGGPDLVVEIESPGDATDDKIPFYAEVRVRELLIIHRDTRAVRLLRHDGDNLAEVEPSDHRNKRWLLSEVLPLAFRRRTRRGERLTEIARTDDVAGHWLI
jgi:Uma2 family endonuclease